MAGCWLYAWQFLHKQGSSSVSLCRVASSCLEEECLLLQDNWNIAFLLFVFVRCWPPFRDVLLGIGLDGMPARCSIKKRIQNSSGKNILSRFFYQLRSTGNFCADFRIFFRFFSSSKNRVIYCGWSAGGAGWKKLLQKDVQPAYPIILQLLSNRKP